MNPSVILSSTNLKSKVYSVIKLRMSVSEVWSKIEVLIEFRILLACLTFKQYLTICFYRSKGNWEARFSSTWKFGSQGTKSKGHTDKGM